jgi:hypothetical protein
MPQIKYLIIAEIDRTGFITEFRNTFKEAEFFAAKLKHIGEFDSYTETDKIINALKKRNYISYHINGNQLCFGKIRIAFTDGLYSVSVGEIDMNTFCLKTLIRERENHSRVFDDNIDDAFLEKFPNIDLIAN